jgi:hypothetical protein
MDDNNYHRSDDDVGIFMKQESVMSVYEPTPMTPTSTKSFLSTPLPELPAKGSNSNTSIIKRNVSYGNLTNQTEARVLVLYTGKIIFTFNLTSK